MLQNMFKTPVIIDPRHGPNLNQLRAQFHAAAQRLIYDGMISANYFSLPVPGHPDLTIDRVEFGNPHYKNVLLIWANRHGGEYGACHANLAFVEAGKELAQRYPKVRFVVYLTNNPYGFGHSRVDESGYNSARNYMYRKPPKNSKLYCDLQHRLISSWVKQPLLQLARLDQALLYLRHGDHKEEFTAGVAGAEFQWHPNAIGAILPDGNGVERCFARVVDEDFITGPLAGARYVFAIDGHSGFGDSNSFMCSKNLSSAYLLYIQDLLKRVPGVAPSLLGDDYVSNGEPPDCFKELGFSGQVISGALEIAAACERKVFFSQLRRSSLQGHLPDDAHQAALSARELRNTHTIPTIAWMRRSLQTHFDFYEAAAFALQTDFSPQAIKHMKRADMVLSHAGLVLMRMAS